MSLSGSPFDIFIAFLGGVLLSFTPCVYPLVPVTVGFIGASSAGSKLKGFLLSLVYVSGIALVYSSLGMAAALTGTIFGSISSKTFVRAGAGAVIIFFGLALLDIFSLPSLNISKPIRPKGRGYLSVFLLGVSSGFLVAPCLTPVLGSILTYIAAKRNVLYGAALLLSFACGMGLLLVVSGTFSSVLVNLPKADKWMLWIKRFCALILIAAGGYFIFTAIRGF